MEADISVSQPPLASHQMSHEISYEQATASLSQGPAASTASQAVSQEDSQGLGEWRSREQDLADFLFHRDNYIQEHQHQHHQLGEEEHDMYEGEDAQHKMMHLMHSDTMIVVIALIVMIILGLVFRSCCLRMTSTKARKERVRGGLKALADHMNSVTKAMSNDLEDHPDSPRAVMRTYSNYGRTKPADQEACEGVSVVSSSPSFLGVHGDGGRFSGGKNPNMRTISRENLRVKAFSNVLAHESVCRPGPNGVVSIEMVEPQRKR